MKRIRLRLRGGGGKWNNARENRLMDQQKTLETMESDLREQVRRRFEETRRRYNAGEPTRAESMLRQVANNAFGRGWKEPFVIDESLPAEAAKQIASPEDAAAVIDCWRGMMHAAVDAAAERFKAARAR
jgi:hypothetical protein